MTTTLLDRLADGETLVLDGGIGTDLQHRGAPMHSEIWSAEAVDSHPELVLAVHEGYIEAGSDVITTNTFATGMGLLAPAGMADRFVNLNKRAIELALEARRRATEDRPVYVAGAISSWEGDVSDPLSPTAARDAYRAQAELFAEAGADLILLEMMHTVEHAESAALAGIETGLPTFVGFSCIVLEDGRVALAPVGDSTPGRAEHPEPLSTIRRLGELGVTGFAVMHTHVSDITPCLRDIRKWWTGSLAAYAHCGRFEMPNWVFDEEISPNRYADFGLEWERLDTRLIGGCCGIDPRHIRALRNALSQTAT